MIREHQFNTKWWGRPVGVCFDPELLALSTADLETALEPYDWVELRLETGSADLGRAARRRFHLVDRQVGFRIMLKPRALSPSAGKLEVRKGREGAFDLSDAAPFMRERFSMLPGMNDELLSARYRLWAEQLLQDSPDGALEILMNGIPQGWFFSRIAGSGRSLDLAMSTADAQVSGALLYERALFELGLMGPRFGSASFSTANLPVLNIYAHLGARFTSATDHFIWSLGG